jgi:hypothetical protein
VTGRRNRSGGDEHPCHHAEHSRVDRLVGQTRGAGVRIIKGVKPSVIPPLVLVLLLVTAGCGEAEDDAAGGGVPSPSAGVALPTPAATAVPSATSSTGPSGGPTGAASAEPDVFPADTDVDSEQESGGPLSVVAVRVARQEGFDRVVFELKGKVAGRPGWRVEYTDDPRQDGSGDPVSVEGAEALSVVITGVGLPFDTGVPETTADPALPAGLGVVQDVQWSSNYEGQYTVFVGTRAKTPFRVFRLSDPARVVLDIRQS